MKYGFTLIELLVSITILAIIFSVLTQAFLSITRGSVKSELVRDIKQSGDFSVSILEQMIRSASSITSPCAVGGTTDDELVLTSPDGRSTRLECLVDAANQITRIASVSGTTVHYLTPENLTLGLACGPTSSLKFTCTSFSSQPPTVSVAFSLIQKGTPPSSFERAQTQFQTTINVRNSNNQ